ncbi:hypothetical protein, partial [Streptomyces sp. NPDC093223]|uniref:hypothetical protein n=1 Tax=Streptomyces sp. NPDC093223 TaxID=3366033 RepID=UPI00380B4915
MTASLALGLACTGLAGGASAAPSSTLLPGQIDPGALNLQYWMNQIHGTIGDRPLNKVVMPGSHDAGSWSITPDSGVCDTA